MGEPRQLHLLGLHGFRTSGRILETQVCPEASLSALPVSARNHLCKQPQVQMSRLQAKLGSLLKVVGGTAVWPQRASAGMHSTS